jgi:hypothetical protein
MLLALKAHLAEQERHFWLFQSQFPHPKSAGAAVFDGEKVHYPFKTSYPAKQVKQFPVSLSKVLHWALTTVQIPSALKKVLSAH